MKTRHTLSGGLGLIAAIAMALPAAASMPTADVGLSASSVASSGHTFTAPVSTAADQGEGDAGTKALLTKEATEAGLKAVGPKATDQESLEAYWTPERMKSAKPAAADPAYQKAVERFEEEQKQLIESGKPDEEQAKEEGPERSVKGFAAPEFTRDGQVKRGNNATGSTARTSAAPMSLDLKTILKTVYPRAVERRSGKVFFTKPGVGNFVCSATVVNSEGLDTVWTAGHCVHGGENGTWSTNWTFAPDYANGVSSDGLWSARQLWSKSDWVNDSDFDEDMGVAIMNTRNGQHIVSRVGGQGFTVNKGKTNVEVAYGYPAEAPFNGQVLRRCSGTTSPEWDVWFIWSHTLKIPCTMTRGSSGGGWFQRYDWTSGTGYLNGVNSRINRIVGPTIMLSPYFDNSAWDLYNSTRNL